MYIYPLFPENYSGINVRTVWILTACCKDYLGLVNRSVCYPCSSVGNTFTFDVVQVSGSNPTSNVSFAETLACAHLKKTHTSPWIPR